MKKGNTYKVHVCRIGYGHTEVTVNGDNVDDIETNAMDEAADTSMSEKSSDYEIQSIVCVETGESIIATPKNSSQIVAMHNELKTELLHSITQGIEAREGQRFEFDNSWEDEVFNDIHAISIENGAEFEGDCYPLSELSLDDALYVLNELENN
jgi:hypothetical protein